MIFRYPKKKHHVNEYNLMIYFVSDVLFGQKHLLKKDITTIFTYSLLTYNSIASIENSMLIMRHSYRHYPGNVLFSLSKM